MSKARLTLCAVAFFVAHACALASIPRYSTNPDDFVRQGLQHFWVNGGPLRFVGYNLRGLCHYGGGDILSDSQASDREANLAYMQSVGAKVARVFVSCRFVNNQTLGDRLDAALEVASTHSIRLIVAFTDEYFSNFCPQGDEVYYGYQGDGILGQTFFATGYRTNYLALVQYLVNRFKNDPTVFAWQLGNELKCPWNPSNILPFCHYMATAIRGLDQRHMVSYGTAGRSFSGLTLSQATQLYADFDFLTVHAYNGDNSNDDSGLANTLRKPLLVSEAGFDTDNPDRPSSTSADIAKWVGRGARGYMNWGLMVVDNGDGDDIFGIDPAGHAYDWAAYTTVYTNWAAALATTPVPPPDPPTGVGATDGEWADRIVVTWNQSFAASDYAIFRAESTGGPQAQVAPWQAGTTFADTSVTRGGVYYYWVKARNSGGQSNYSLFDPGYASDAPEVTIAGTKSLANGTTAYVTGGIISAAFSGEFYIQQAGRTSGLCVVWPEVVPEGNHANVLGTISAPTGGQRKLTAISVVTSP